MIVGVAIRNDNVLITLPKPARHVDCFELAKSLGIDFIAVGLGKKADNPGFYTHTGKYLNRMQAAKYIKRIKQKTLDGKYRQAICSEDLW